jgi:hypothetical protein
MQAFTNADTPTSTDVTTGTSTKVESLDSDDRNTLITLVSNDKKEFSILKHHAMISGLIETMLQDGSTVANINMRGTVLQYIVKYMEHHAGVDPGFIEKPLKPYQVVNNKLSIEDRKWDCDFINDPKLLKERSELPLFNKEGFVLYCITLGANYMHITGLLSLCTAKIASMLKGQPLNNAKSILLPDTDGVRGGGGGGGSGGGNDTMTGDIKMREI